MIDVNNLRLEWERWGKIIAKMEVLSADIEVVMADKPKPDLTALRPRDRAVYEIVHERIPDLDALVVQRLNEWRDNAETEANTDNHTR